MSCSLPWWNITFRVFTCCVATIRCLVGVPCSVGSGPCSEFTGEATFCTIKYTVTGCETLDSEYI